MSTIKLFPTQSYLHAPEQPSPASDTLFRLDQLARFYCIKDEFPAFR
jgi:hypothetical protein